MPVRTSKNTYKKVSIYKNRKTVKKSNQKAGGFLWTWDTTKFAYIMANSAYKYAMENDSKDYNTSDYDEKLKLLLKKIFRKIFVKFIDTYRHNTDIKDGTNKKSLNLVINSIKEYKKTGDYNYDIVKYKSSMQYSNYVKKLLDDYIKDFVNYLKTNNNYKSYESSSIIQAPESTKSSSEPFSTITFYDRNKNTVKVPNILYRISKPQIPSDDKHENKTRMKLRYSTTYDFLNSYSQYVTAFNYYVKYRVEK